MLSICMPSRLMDTQEPADKAQHQKQNRRQCSFNGSHMLSICMPSRLMDTQEPAGSSYPDTQ
jgi:hypothetical protein